MFRLTVAFLLLVAAPIHADGIRVGTWNIQHGKKIKKILREIRESPLSTCDIATFQEVLTGEEGGQGKEIAKAMQGEMVKAGRDIIVSKLPVLAGGEIRLRPARSAVWADLKLPSEKALRFYGVHLTYKVGWHPFIPKIRDREMAVLLDHAASFNGPVIVAGDFNTVGWFLCCHRDAPLIASLRAAGFEEARIEGITQRFGGLVDWIFVKGMTIRDVRLGEYAGSDHKWMTASLEEDAKTPANR